MIGTPDRVICDDSRGEFHVRDAATAIKIAKIALEQEFGSGEMKKMRYFEASLDGDRWIVLAHPYKRGGKRTHGGSIDFVVGVKGVY